MSGRAAPVTDNVHTELVPHHARHAGLLTQLGVTELQGFLLGRPEPEAAATARAREAQQPTPLLRT